MLIAVFITEMVILHKYVYLLLLLLAKTVISIEVVFFCGLRDISIHISYLNFSDQLSRVLLDLFKNLHLHKKNGTGIINLRTFVQ